jgi:hypothetical protein
LANLGKILSRSLSSLHPILARDNTSPAHTYTLAVPLAIPSPFSLSLSLSGHQEVDNSD